MNAIILNFILIKFSKKYYNIYILYSLYITRKILKLKY